MIHARIDETTKQQAEEIFHSLGLTATQAIRLFYQQVTLRNGLPFEVRLPNAAIQAAIKEARQSKLVTFNFDDA